MATRGKDGQITETDGEATQAERSPDTFYILVASLLALVAIGVGLLWYYGVIG